ncbi:hypothetical protein NC652_025485 [Populus alba x Populus x berolinensis]|nr:hypothetical protein NC652_025485 [Populus alba x Populus x berolinensis]
MAMPPGNVVIPDKMQFPAGTGGGGAAAGNEIHQHHPQRHQWFPVDERDGFISWLRGEFAAANAIIDSLCHHLRAVGEPGEYDLVVGCIQQRGCNWNHVLHMQQYFSVGEVVAALQQACTEETAATTAAEPSSSSNIGSIMIRVKIGGKGCLRDLRVPVSIEGIGVGGGGEAVKEGLILV